jgi:phage terminase large subunit
VTSALTRPRTTVRHVYEPWGAAKSLFGYRGKEVLLSGPAGTGKTRACLEKLHLMALLNPGMRGLILRKVAADLASTALVTWKEHVAKEALALGLCDYFGGSRSEAAGYRYTNGSFIAIGGMNNPDQIMSSEYDAIYVQEATQLTITDWEMANTRLRNGVVSFQQLIADTNPDTPTHWLKQRADAGVTVLFESRHKDNPRLYQRDGTLTADGADYMGRLDDLTGVRLARLRDGKWVATDGQVYESYDAAVHSPTLADIAALHDGWPDTRLCAKGLPWHWQRWWSIDFGFTNPTVIQRWAEDDDGRLYLYAEQYMTQRLVEDHVKDLRRVIFNAKGQEREPEAWSIICDHDAEDRATFRKHYGRGTVSAVKWVKPGIQAVQSRLKVQADGRPRLYLLRGALAKLDQSLRDAGKPASTLDEIGSYVWDQQEGKVSKDVPVKENDHGMDAMRYVVARVDRVTSGIKRRAA